MRVESPDDINQTPPNPLSIGSRHEAAFTGIKLPSRGIPYRNLSKLEVRPMTVPEVKRARSVIEGTTEVTMAEVLKSVSRPLAPADLTFGDFEYLCLWLRVNTFPHAPYIHSWTCPVCGHENTLVIDPLRIECEELPVEFREPAILRLPNSGLEIPLRLSRVGDNYVIERFLKGLYPGGDWPEDEHWLAELAMTIDNGKKIQDNIEILRPLHPEDVAVIDEFQTAFNHGFPDTFTDTCAGKIETEEALAISKRIKLDRKRGDTCGFENKRIHITFRLSDLVPMSGYAGYIRNAVRFGSSAEHTAERA